MPKVSIGLPVFNAGSDLEKTIKSIEAQTFTDYEVIAFDNASFDGSAEVLAKYAARDNRVTLTLRGNNLGHFKNFYDCFTTSIGEFFCWWAADDWRSPDWISNCVNTLRNDPGAVAATSPYCFDYDIDNTHNWHTFEVAGPDRLRILAENFFKAHSIFYSLIRRSTVRDWFISNEFKDINAADWSFMIYIACSGNILRTKEGLQIGGTNGFSSQGRWVYQRSYLESIAPLSEALIQIDKIMSSSNSINQIQADEAMVALLELEGSPARGFRFFNDLSLYPMQGFDSIEILSDKSILFWCITESGANSDKKISLRLSSSALHANPCVVNPSEDQFDILITSQKAGKSIEIRCDPGATLIPIENLINEQNWPTEDTWLASHTAGKNRFYKGNDPRDLYFAISYARAGDIGSKQPMSNAANENPQAFNIRIATYTAALKGIFARKALIKIKEYLIGS